MKIITLAVVGRLLVWVLQTSGPTKKIWKLHPFLTELGECDFCLGCWVFSAMAYIFGFNLLDPIYVPVLSEVVTGILVSLISHLAALGWKQRWGYEILE